MPQSAFLRPALSAPMVQALDAALGALPEVPSCLAVALSGGADSAMLAVHAAAYARERGLELHCFHIHHGLQEPADRWQAHVHDLAQRLRLPCHSLRVQVTGAADDGMESAARDARYRAFSQLAALTGVQHLLLAHHRNDQAETVLLRLLRGAGPTGLAAMAPSMRRDGLTYLRPWLDIARADILAQAAAFEAATGWAPVHDPTNADDTYTRAAVRERLVPDLDERWPGWQATLLRHARQSAEVAQILDEVAAQDFAGLDPGEDGRSFSLASWRLLSPARQALVLRYWLGRLGQRMPTDARLQDLMRQLRTLHALGHDRQMQVKHGAAVIRCTRGRVMLDVPAVP
ncbi:MAG: tRNA lysidine(34) synthetase TilS [Candidimonas sp.]|nr:tRNA lysidine(34) synthetase TilS [Candidimonas sp.]